MEILYVVIALVLPFAVLMPILLKMMGRAASLRNDFTVVWTGITNRGYIEAMRWGYLTQKPDKTWLISQEARDVYAPITPQLKSLWRLVRSSLNADPSPDAYTWVVEHDSDLQEWMTTKACPTLGVYQYGCLAIACEIAREQ